MVRLGKPVWGLVPGVAGLLLFAWLLTLRSGPAGCICAAIYIAVSVAWM